MYKTVRELAELVGGKVIGDERLKITGITNINQPQKGFVTFVSEPRYLPQLENSDISCIIVPPSISSSEKTLILCGNPKLAWAKLLRVFHPPRKYPGTVSPLAFISPSANLGKNVTIEPYVYIGDEVRIGEGSVIRANTYLDSQVIIGANVLIYPNVTIYGNSIIGNKVIIHAGAVIGSDGFGYVHSGEEQFKILQIGNVIIEDEVEIGANVTIDRATMGSTIIKKGVKIDNLVQIAHNVEIGENTVASAQVGISGSSKIGKDVILAGQVGIGDHCEIGDRAVIAAQSGLPTKKKVPAEGVVFGTPARPIQEAKKQFAAQMHSAETMEEVNELKKKIANLERELLELKEIAKKTL